MSELIENTQYGYNAAANDIGTHKFLRIGDIKEGDVNWEGVPFCDCKDEKTYKLFDDDILVARTGGTTGKSFIITNPPDNAVFAGYLIRMRAQSEIDPIFIYEFLNSYVYWSQMSNLKMGSAQPNVTAEKLKSLIVPFGPDHVIKEVVHFFKTGNSKIKELNERVNQGQAVQKSNFQLNDLFSEQLFLLSALRQAILTEAVQGQLTAQWRKENPNHEHARELLKRIAAEKAQLIKEKKISKEKPLPEIKEEKVPYKLPEGWVWCSMQEISSFITDGKHGDCQNQANSGYYFLSVKNMKNGALDYTNARQITFNDFAEVHKRTNLMPGDILVSSTGATIGKVAIARDIDETPRTIFQKSVAIIKVFQHIYPSNYIKIFLEGNVQSLQKMAGGSAQPNLLISDLRRLIVSFPALPEQHAIVQKVNTLLAYCDELEQQVKQRKADLDLLMQSVLSEVFGTKNQAVSSKPVKTKLSKKKHG